MSENLTAEEIAAQLIASDLMDVAIIDHASGDIFHHSGQNGDVTIARTADMPAHPAMPDPDRGEQLLDVAVLHRKLQEAHGIDEMPMLHETRDGNNRVGYAYEGEPLLTYVKPVGEGYVCMVAKHVPLREGDSRRMTDPLTYQKALDYCFLLARTLPSGLPPRK